MPFLNMKPKTCSLRKQDSHEFIGKIFLSRFSHTECTCERGQITNSSAPTTEGSARDNVDFQRGLPTMSCCREGTPRLYSRDLDMIAWRKYM
jgi:hypothetical protein